MEYREQFETEILAGGMLRRGTGTPCDGSSAVTFILLRAVRSGRVIILMAASITILAMNLEV